MKNSKAFPYSSPYSSPLDFEQPNSLDLGNLTKHYLVLQKYVQQYKFAQKYLLPLYLDALSTTSFFSTLCQCSLYSYPFMIAINSYEHGFSVVQFDFLRI